MPELRALIADDEELGRIAVRLLLERDPRVVIAAEVADGVSAIERLAAGGIAVAFLAIRFNRLGETLQAGEGLLLGAHLPPYRHAGAGAFRFQLGALGEVAFEIA